MTQELDIYANTLRSTKYAAPQCCMNIISFSLCSHKTLTTNMKHKPSLIVSCIPWIRFCLFSEVSINFSSQIKIHDYDYAKRVL